MIGIERINHTPITSSMTMIDASSPYVLSIIKVSSLGNLHMAESKTLDLTNLKSFYNKFGSKL